MTDDDARNNAEGETPDDLRDPVADELGADPLVPDPESDLEEPEDTTYSDRENES